MRSREGGKRQTLTATNKALSAPPQDPSPLVVAMVITDQLVKKLGAWSLRGRAQGLVVLVSCLDRLPPS